MSTLDILLLGTFSCLGLYGGPEMLKWAEVAEAAGDHRSANLLRKGSWVTLIASPIVAVILVIRFLF